MSKGLATKTRKNTHKKTMESKIPAWLWVVTGAILGAFVMFLMRLSEVEAPARPASKPLIDSSIIDKAKEELIPITFYDKLRESSPIELPEIKPATRPKTQAKAETSEKVSYLIQVASFKSLDDAEQLRAELIMLGMTNAHTRKVKLASGDTRHRVILGPITTHAELDDSRRRLLLNKYEALVLKQKL